MLLPPSTNAAYRGAPIAAWFVVLLGIGWIVPGMIHMFLPDGGAGVIAGIDFGAQARTIIAIFAWAGATQFAHGTLMVAVGLRYRPLVPLVLAISLVERGLLSIFGWVWKAPPPGAHHPPEHYGSLVLVPVIGLFLWLSLRQQGAKG
ncbi:MAG: hypothetical protein H2054_06325 [Sphingomonas sp.]|uniref:hypothetical protein n=1 Tax=Sphingomonas sp. TaxID=28214 RepID=UPI00185BC27A|nr:hypothetical protein [Sphingomonas sp.]